MEKEPSGPTAQGWMMVRPSNAQKSEKKKGAVYPKRHYWCGYNSQGKERWYIELSNGRIVSHLDENYQYWLRKYKVKMREEKKV